jgi:hypothetical protein
MFQFSSFASGSLCVQQPDDGTLLPPGFPIRRSPDLQLFAPPRSLSQLATSFIAFRRQGIHHMPLLA